MSALWFPAQGDNVDRTLFPEPTGPSSTRHFEYHFEWAAQASSSSPYDTSFLFRGEWMVSGAQGLHGSAFGIK